MKPVPETREAANAPTMRRDMGETIVPSSRDGVSGEAVSSTIDRTLDLFDTIGEGGMGVVRRGEQRALRREVAVKGLKPAHRNARAAWKLMREARVTGGLEHPNVIPVYEIAEETDGSPLIVLKKVEGVEWAALMHDSEAVRERFGTDDILEWNVRVLVQVCNVIEFAHSRRVLHRDLKPSNVMIGEFGEVYVLDWGIAVTLADAPGALLPRASEATELAGTPVYMAPEMVGGRAGLISERTDVYLLGGTLYEIVTGDPPHLGAHLPEIIRSILGDDPQIPEHVPAELAAILKRALHRDASKRFESADALRVALEEFLRYRTAMAVARSAEARLATLIEKLGEAGTERDAIYRLYGECRFGLRQALEQWPTNESLRRSIALATVKMVEQELTRGEPKAARVLLADLDVVPPELEARVKERERAAADEYDELRRLREDLDPSRGSRIRKIASVGLCVLWVVYPLEVEAARVWQHWSYSPGWAVAATAAVLAIVIGVAWWSRHALLSTAINRRLGVAIVLSTFVALLQSIVVYLTGGSILGGLHDRLLGATAIVAMLAASVHWGLLVAAAGYAIAYVVIALIGVDRVLYATSAANLVLFVNLYWVLARTGGPAKM